jgi:hypothetical protein
MKENTRGVIEKELDELFGDEPIVEDIKWVEKEIPISSIKDLALGYAIGFMIAFSFSLIGAMERRRKISEEEEKEEEEQVETMIRRRLPEIMKCIETELGR